MTQEIYVHWSHFNFTAEQWREAAQRFLELRKRLAELEEFDNHIDHDGLAEAFVTCHLCAEIREMEGDYEEFAKTFAPIWAEKALR